MIEFNLNSGVSREDSRKEEIRRQIGLAQNYLEKEFGVKNLTTIEGVRLRNIVEKLIHHKPSPNELNMLPDLSTEIALRWIDELYDMRPEDIYNRTIIRDETDNGKEYVHFRGENYSDVKENSRKVKQKYYELKSLGHKVSFQSPVDQKFKDYLRLVREKAHLL